MHNAIMIRKLVRCHYMVRCYMILQYWCCGNASSRQRYKFICIVVDGSSGSLHIAKEDRQENSDINIYFANQNQV